MNILLRRCQLLRIPRAPCATGHLDASKHLVIGKYGHPVYDEAIGEFEFVKRANRSTYPSVHTSAIQQELSSNFKALTALAPEDYAFYSFEELEIDIKASLGQILLNLSKNIIVPENKYRWLQEQRIRLVLSNEVFSAVQVHKLSPKQFSDVYNQIIWDSVEVSNGKMAGSIRGLPSPLEDAIKGEQRLSKEERGVAELKADRGQNRNTINQFMRWLHQ